jgi:RNA polymerase sigma factor (sigma-70 family)
VYLIEPTAMFNSSYLDSIPTLPKREKNIDKYATYLTVNTQNGHLVLQWKHQPSLKRNIELYEKMNQEFSSLCSRGDKGKSIVYFWRDIALREQQNTAEWEPCDSRKLALEHLASYFEERCYWAAKDLYSTNNEKSWEEYLFIARLTIHNPSKLGEILSKYDSRKADIDTYVKEALLNNIKYEATTNRFSRWRLLCKKSNKELKEALLVSGLCEPEISQIIFAHKYFKQVYLINKVQNPDRQTGKKWPEPDGDDFEKSAQCYNKEKLLPIAPHEVSASSTKVNGKKMLTWMETCIESLQNYPKSIVPQASLEALQSVGYEAEYENKNQNLELEWQDNFFPEELEEEELLANKISSALSSSLEVIKPEFKKVLLLYYGLGLNQKQIAAKLKINQSTISRCLAKSIVILLDTVACISHPQQWVQPYVKSWLEREYRTPQHSDLIQAGLVSAIKKLTSEEKEILQLCYGQQISEKQIADRLGLSQLEITVQISQAKNKLQSNLIDTINSWTKEYLEKWLSKHYKSLVYSICQNISKSNIFQLEQEEKINAVFRHCAPE